MQYQQQSTYVQQQQSTYQGGIVQQQQFMGQSSQHQVINNGSTSGYQHSIDDLLVQPTVTLQNNLFSSQESVPSSQSVSLYRMFSFDPFN